MFGLAERVKRRKQKGLIRMAVAEGSFDLIFFIAVTLLLVIGLVMLFSASYPYALQKYKNSTHFFYRQLVFAVMGYVLRLCCQGQVRVLQTHALFGFSLHCSFWFGSVHPAVGWKPWWLTIPGLTGFTMTLGDCKLE